MACVVAVESNDLLFWVWCAYDFRGAYKWSKLLAQVDNDSHCVSGVLPSRVSSLMSLLSAATWRNIPGDILDFHGRPLEPRMSDLCLLSRLSRKKKNAPFCLAKLLVASILWDDVELNAKSSESGLEPALISFSLVSPVRIWTFRMIIVFKLFPSKHPLQKLIKAHWNNWFSWIKVKIIDIERLHRNSLAFTYNTSFDQFCDRVYHTHRISLRILIGYIAQRCCCEWFKDACLLRTKRYWT